jgi:hypothetical protein
LPYNSLATDNDLVMGCAMFRFYGELTDFLSDETNLQSVTFDDPPSVKDRIEACGVPHTEVDLIVVDGRPVDFSYRLGDGDRIGVYPVFRSLETGFRLRPDPPVDRFLVDVNLGKLANICALSDSMRSVTVRSATAISPISQPKRTASSSPRTAIC